MKSVWERLEHKGICFPPEYSARGLKIAVRGQEVPLSPLAEEMAYHFAKKKDTPYVKDPVFVTNFMSDFVQQLPAECGNLRFEDVDFSRFYELVDQEKRHKESMGKEEKKTLAAQRKLLREQLRQKYGRAIVDGREVEIANWMAEPPGLFMGRGNHPLRGHWKPRVTSKDVVLNIGEGAQPPPGEWGAIVNDHESVWFAKWIDKLTHKEKYVWPHESSHIQQSRTKEKYEKASRTGKHLDRIRSRILKSMSSGDLRERKTATACYLIDRLGMRVGDEKDEDEADTVGATTLRVEHVKTTDERIEFDFLGKDAVKWFKVIPSPEKVLVKNLRDFASGKAANEQIFDGVSSATVNKFFSRILQGLTAKVFRTYHASLTTEAYLRSVDVSKEDEVAKIYHAKMANLEAAVFCNHKRTPPKNWEESLERKKEKLTEYESSGKEERARKMKMAIDLALKTRDYNLNTSLKNYIDPRIYKSWCGYVGLDWGKLYTKSLQRKFEWAEGTHREWNQPVQVVAVARGEKVNGAASQT